MSSHPLNVLRTLLGGLLVLSLSCTGGSSSPSGGGGGTVASFSVSLASAALTAAVPGSGTSSVTTGVQVIPAGGFSGNVSFSLQGAPTGVNGVFTPTVSATASSLRVAIAPGASPGTYNLTVKGSSPGVADASAALSLTLTGAPRRERLPVVAAVEAQYTKVLAQYSTPLEQIKALGAFMTARSEYTRVAVDEAALSVTGELQNGWIHYVGNNPSLRQAGPASAPAFAPAPSSAAFPAGWPHAGPPRVGVLPAAAAGTANPLPSSNSARLINAFENFALPDDSWGIGNLRPMLTKAGWTVLPGESGSVESLLLVGGDGFLYFQGHGGYGQWWNTSGAKEIWHCLQTSTLEDNAKSNAAYLDDLRTRRLVLITEKTFDSVLDPSTGKWVDQSATWYGVTYLWVQRYWGNFSNNAVIFLNACHSGRIGSASASLFLDAVKQKGSPNAVFGWSNSVYGPTALTASCYFVDRCLGANSYHKENPAQRPFPWDAVQTWMHSKKYDGDPATTVLVAFPNGAQPALLAPSIRQVIIDEFWGEMKLYGAFGSDEGTVKVGGNPVAVKSGKWAADQITCELPKTAAGDVVVEVRSLKSNPRPLTEWQVPVGYSWSGYFTADPVVAFSCTPNVRYRLDVSGYREKPGDPPHYPKLGTWPVVDSDITFRGSGTGPLGSCTATLTGSSTIPTTPYSTPNPPISVQAPFLVDAKAKTGAIGLAIAGPVNPVTFTSPWTLLITGGSNCGPGSGNAFPTFGLLQGVSNFPQSPEEGAAAAIPLPALSLAFGSGFELQPMNWSDSRMTGTMKVIWGLTAPASPPRPEDAGI